ncbi:MAG: maleylpyruvate isomerase family mycothiol-dependent enzyme [Janibacter sp.]
MSDVWDLVHTERAALIADLEGLTDEQWARPSLCAGWSIHDVAAHLVDNARATPFGVIWAMARARFDFDRQNDEGLRRAQGATPQETLQRLREVASRTSGPPAPADSRLVEEVLHGEDIRRPLGLTRRYEPEAVTRALRYQARTPTSVGGGKEVAAKVELRPTGSSVVLGDGPEVTGPALAMLMVISGRSVALGDLTGPGVAALR